MSMKVYELRCFRGEIEVMHAARVRAVLDLSDLDVYPGVLNRHLYAVAERNGETRDSAHLFHMELRETDRHNSMARDVLFKWALPVLPEGER